MHKLSRVTYTDIIKSFLGAETVSIFAFKDVTHESLDGHAENDTSASVITSSYLKVICDVCEVTEWSKRAIYTISAWPCATY